MSEDRFEAAVGRMTRRKAVAGREEVALSDIKARAAVPGECGGDIPAAPGRGPMATFTPHEAVLTDAGGVSVRKSGWQGRKAARCADVFDQMLISARRAKKDAPLTKGQIVMARFYRDLNERHASAGVRCSSLESVSRSSGGSGGEWIDAVLRDREFLDRLRRRVGDGSHKGLRVIRPSKRGSRVTIFDRRLVDMVCIEEMTLSQVLRAHGWSEYVGSREAVRVALAAALDRMAGPVVGGQVSVWAASK